ncbi:MAG: hypothetical protein GC136_10060 [Alphaproteobacteria bacterium]|nr:hypothetical protein [Alphaproteobacteria bacterium]
MAKADFIGALGLSLSLQFAVATAAEAQITIHDNPLASEITRIQQTTDCTNNSMTAQSLTQAGLPESAAERQRQVECTLADLYNAGQEQYILTPAEYFARFGLSADAVARVTPYLPQDYTVITENYPQALAFLSAYEYMEDFQLQNADPGMIHLVSVLGTLTTQMRNSYFTMNFGNTCNGCDGGVIYAPDPAATFPTLMNASFTLPHMQQRQYQQDMALLVVLHELGHPYCITGSGNPAFQQTANHSEACSDIYALTMLAVLRGGVTQAMRDFVMWRKMTTINSTLDDRPGRTAVFETHGTGQIIESYLNELSERRSFPPSLLRDISDIPRLMRSRHFRAYNDADITGATDEAFDLMLRYGLRHDSWAQRVFAAQRTLNAIERGEVRPAHALTRRIIDDYREATDYWGGITAAQEPIAVNGRRPQ